MYRFIEFDRNEAPHSQTLPPATPALSVEKMLEARSPHYVPPEEDFFKILGITEGQDEILSFFVFATGDRSADRRNFQNQKSMTLI